jgi:GNAT superfamily N-acetyltransferase
LLSIIPVDFNNAAHGDMVLALLNEYALDPMGGQAPLSEHVRTHLIAALAARPNAGALMALHHDEPAGLAIYFEGFSTFACQPLLNLHDFMVREKFQGLGIAKQLLGALEKVAQDRHCCKITLEVLQGNVPAQTLYRKMGYEGYSLSDEMGQAMFWQKKITR